LAREEIWKFMAFMTALTESTHPLADRVCKAVFHSAAPTLNINSEEVFLRKFSEESFSSLHIRTEMVNNLSRSARRVVWIHIACFEFGKSGD
jgi:hypothetical protein